MDFEEQLEKVEKLATPSLVGSSLRSADDSAHNNYIHPEKSATKSKSAASGKKSPKKKSSLINSTLGASLDDLISEGALLGSEEDFDSYLDEAGNITAEKVVYKKSPLAARETASEPTKPADDVVKPKKESEAELPATAKTPTTPVFDNAGPESHATVDVEEEEEPEIDQTPKPKKKQPEILRAAAAANASVYQNEGFSTPNLSDYQLENQITDHSDLLNSVQSNDPQRLPQRLDYFGGSGSGIAGERPSAKKTTSFTSTLITGIEQQPQIAVKDAIHAPFFPKDRDGRSSSRSRTADAGSDGRSRSRSRSSARPHLARGDSYKNTHDSDPTHYELPGEVEEEIKEEDEGAEVDTRSRISKPTMGESIARREREQSGSRRSLVTTGGYTNFDVDTPTGEDSRDILFAARSLSSTNYLRNISRSRSRQPGEMSVKPARTHSLFNEKNDANTDELLSEGALLNDSGYSAIEGLDAMVDKVLHLDEKKTEDDGKKKTPILEEIKETDVKTESSKVNEKPDAKKNSESEKIEKNESKLDIKKETEPVTKIEQELKTENEVISKEEVEEDKKEEVEKEAAKQIEDEKEAEEEKKAEEKEIEEEKKAEEKEFEEEKKAEENEAGVDELFEKEIKEESKDTILLENTTKEISDKSIESEKDVKEANTVEEAVTDSSEIKHTKDVKVDHSEISKKLEEKEDAETVDKDDEKGAEVEKEVAIVKNLQEEDEKEKEEEVEKKEDKKVVNEAKEVDKVHNADEKAIESKEAIAPEEDELKSEAKDGDSIKEKVAHVTHSIAKALQPEPKAVAPAALVETKKVEEDDFDLGDLDISPEELRKHLEAQPVYIFTSFAGGMQIVTRTNRLSTILTGNQVKFTLRDLGTDEEAKKIWRRYSGGKLLPGVVRGDDFIGNFQDIEDANEEYRVREILYETL